MNFNKFFLLCLSLLSLFLLASCGGGSDSAPTSVPTTSATLGTNAISVTVAGGTANNINLPLVSLTICAPGGSTCQVVDNVLVDTGSSGVRIFASALNASIVLPQQTLGDGRALLECTPFADGNTWGPIRVADVKIASEAANALPVQIISDPQFPTAPQACSDTGPLLSTPALFGTNGVIGVGVFRQDCGSVCAQTVGHQVYFGCSDATTCATVQAPLIQQVQNPVAFFAVNNNGIALALPAVPPGGAPTVVGTLSFGLGTQANSGLNGTTVLKVDPITGFFSTIYKGVTLSRGFIDSGSNGLFFTDNSIPTCSSGFYCPPSTLSLTATNVGVNGTQSTVPFSVANADAVVNANPTSHAFNDLAGSAPGASMFDWGLPFFYGRTIFAAIEDANTPAGPGPYFAY